jgi:hypothetical protein
VTVYLETSALIRAAALRQADVIKHMATATRWVSSALTGVECERTLLALVHGKRLSRRQANAAHAFLREVFWRTDLRELDSVALDRAAQPFPVEPVRTLGALHLAAIAQWAELGPVSVLTCDARLRDNVLAMGLEAPPLGAEPR